MFIKTSTEKHNLWFNFLFGAFLLLLSIVGNVYKVYLKVHVELIQFKFGMVTMLVQKNMKNKIGRKTCSGSRNIDENKIV